MNFELFIAKNIIRSSGTTSKGVKPIVKIATFSIILGIAVMIVALGIVDGFQQQIKEKVSGFGSHIQITGIGNNNAIENLPIDKNQPFYSTIDTLEGVNHIQSFAYKAGILKTDTDLNGIVIKGIDTDFDFSFFAKKLVEGQMFKIDSIKRNDTILLSKKIATNLSLSIGNSVRAYFIQDPPRVRKFIVGGIYETGMEKFDNTFIVADIKHIIKLNNWTENQIGGFELILDGFQKLDEINEEVYHMVGMDLKSSTIRERNQEIFNWLDLQDWNVIIIISLMILVAGINMISALLILILERTNMIGLLKALGASNYSIRKVFLYNVSYLIGKGLLYGNLIGLVLCFLQYQFHIVSLPEESYYISYVPIKLNFLKILALNGVTFIICLVMLVVPSYVIARIEPVKAIRFN